MNLTFNRNILIGIFIIVLLGVSHYKAFTFGKQETQLKFDQYKLKQFEAIVKIQDELNKSMKGLELENEHLKKSKREEISKLQDNLAATIDKLRKRETRDNQTYLSDPTSIRTGCTGTELFFEDGEFLAREAARADKLAIELLFCQNQYNSGKKAIDDFIN